MRGLNAFEGEIENLPVEVLDAFSPPSGGGKLCGRVRDVSE